MHDETYKRLFAFPRMVEDLLRGFVAGPRADDIDFSTLQKLSSEYVSDELLKRHGDAVWQVRLRGRWLYLVVMLEFQSRDEPWMALRILTYTGLMYEELVRNGKVKAGEPLPAVLYNGARPWRSAQEMGELITAVGPDFAPCQPAQWYHVVDERHVAKDDRPGDNLMSSVVQLEQSGSAADLIRVAEALGAKLSDPGDAALRRVFLDWVRQTAARAAPAGEELPPVETLEEVKMTLVERAAEWGNQWRQEGVEQGVKQGVEQGLAQQRALLRRQAALRFGTEAGARVSEAVERIADPEGLATAGDWIVRAESGDELVARLTQLADRRDTP